MRNETRIVLYNNNSSEQMLIKTITDVLYTPMINQKIHLLDEGIPTDFIIVSVEDRIYEDIIYRYVYVVKVNK